MFGSLVGENVPVSGSATQVFVAGSGLYAVCPDCGKLVKLNKFIFGSAHICVNK